ncbi:MAG TPA: protein kinase, partial [Pyrinomonadaceae bacterium]|nr:protein kinase [Pyrinomonadaceae bacterium]
MARLMMRVPSAALVSGIKRMVTANAKISRYRIISKIASGGMGQVYLASDTRLNRKVALKILSPEVVNNRDRLQRFEQEAQAASALNHPNIITIYEVGADGDMHFIAMEFIEGETLRRRLKMRRLEINETLNIATQIATALDAAHRSRIVHRDIKPENVMVREDGLVKVLDFGLAKSTESKAAEIDTEAATRAQVNTNPGMIIGTVAYMSPEQARGKPVDARTDVWSLGVVLYEMVNAHLPFLGETVSDTIAAILKSEPPLLHEDTPGELQRIIRKTLHKNTEERYQTVKDLLIDLKNLKQDLELAATFGREPTAATDRNAVSETKTGSAATRDPTRAVSTIKYVLGELKKHKVDFAAGVAVLMLAAIGLGYWFYSSQDSTIESIAVMPFVNESGNADTDYLSDGMTEVLISSLSQIPKLNVKARSAVFRYKGKNIDPRQVGTELGVQAVLNGRVVQRGDQLTLSLELVNTRTENVIWTEQYNRRHADLVSLQSDIARDVAKKLQAKLSAVDESRVARRYTENTEAYELYLKGRFFAGGQVTEEGLAKSIHYQQQAIEKDPNFALAYVGLARSYMTLGHVWGFLPPHETFPKGKVALTKALQIDETLADAHTALADYYYSYEWNWLAAEQEFNRAIELNPNDASAHCGYGSYFQSMERFDKAIVERKLCRELDPLSPTATANVGYPYYFARQYDQAIGHYRKALELDPNYSWAYLWIGQAYLGKGMPNEAIANINKAIALSEGNVRMKATLGYAYAVAGRRGEGQQIIDELQIQSKQKYVSAYFIAVIYSGLGEKDHAFAWLEKAYQERHPYLTLLKVEPVFDNLR